MNRISLVVVVVEVIFAAVGLVAGWWLGTPILEDVRFDLRSVALAFAATLPLIALVYLEMHSQLPLMVRLRTLLREAIVPLFASCSVLEILLISIMAGIGEEIFFRGFLQGWLGGVINPWIALVLVSALFGLAHYVSSGYAIVTFVIGLYLGTLWLLTGNLFVAIAVHALFDVVALLMILRMNLSPATEPGLP